MGPAGTSSLALAYAGNNATGIVAITEEFEITPPTAQVQVEGQLLFNSTTFLFH